MVCQYAEKIKEKNPSFKIALGNEIYLTETRDCKQKYYHFILIAKNAQGHKALRELSSKAWENVYIDRRMERVPTLKSELEEVVNRYPNTLIATSACAGGELSTLALAYANAVKSQNQEEARKYYNKIYDFINFCLKLFKDDFYIECAPSDMQEQCTINYQLYKIAKAFNIKMVVGTDSHYLTEKERPIHAAYLNAKEGDREVDSFYKFTYLMDYDEVYKLLKYSFQDEFESDNIISQILLNTKELENKIEQYTLFRKQIIPKIDVEEYSKLESENEYTGYPTLDSLLNSNNPQERYWINECLKELSNKDLWKKEYLERLEIEADIIKNIGNKLDDCLFAYFNTFKHYIDLFWACGSIVGPGRGSATGFLSNYLLGITQLDPIRWNLKYWRFLNKERAELPDIDVDLAPSKRPFIFDAIRKERGKYGLVQVATFGTEGTKSAILTACRGYRSEDYPSGIDVDEAQYMSSLIPQERGFLWDINDVVYGNEEKDRKPVKDFLNSVSKYPGLLDIITYICGLVNKRSSHASGVVLYGNDPFETASFMKTPGGDLITCYDLHMAEACGDTKYDFLVTEISDKIITCLELLKKDEVISYKNLREAYNTYLHPEILDTTRAEIWSHLEAGDILDVFQFNEGSGLAIAKKCKPKNIFEMLAASAMMRLMSEKGKESQQDRYVRIKNQGLIVFEKEMLQKNIPEETRKAFHKHCDIYYGCVPVQEQMMEILMDSNIANFTLAEANAARKIVAKKKMNEIPKLREQVFQHIPNNAIAEYTWDTAIRPSLGYAFSINHSLPYSFVGVQAIHLATHFNPIYWNCSCLIVNSGALDNKKEEEIVDIYEPEGDDLVNGVTFEDLPDGKSKIRKASTDYSKIAKAIGDIMAANIKVSTPNINNSDFGFKPDVENNQILYGLKGMLNVSDDTVNAIILNRPYTSPKDFYLKVKPSKQTMVSLIKGGAFDSMMDRKKCLIWYLWETCDKKSRLTLQNMPGLVKANMVPRETEEQDIAFRIYEFNKYLKNYCKNGEDYYLDETATRFLNSLQERGVINFNFSENLEVKKWDKIYQAQMDVFRDWIAADKDNILRTLNEKIFYEDWLKYAGKGNLSAWEMEVLCFYYHEHELNKVDNRLYGFANFFELPEEPVVERTYGRNGDIKIFKLSKICGTCIAKNKAKSTVSLLTTNGVVNVKMNKEFFSLYDRQISEKKPDGTKKVLERSFFNRGSMIVVMGVRSGDDFLVKKYSNIAGHRLYHIDKINEDGTLVLRTERKNTEYYEDNSD